MIFELSPDGFVAFDEDRRVNYVSPAFASLTQIPVSTLNGVTEAIFSDLLAQACLPSARFQGVQRLRESAASGSSRGPTSERQLVELAASGRRVLEVGLRISTLHAVSQVLYFRDVTHETEVDRMKTEFLSTAAHELRTPMASIYGFAEVLLTQRLDETSRNEFTEIIFKQAEQMSSILNELLDLARIEARQGKDFVLKATNVSELVAETVNGFGLPGGRLAPTITTADGVGNVMVDRKKAQQAVLNVLSNAYKYSKSGNTVDIFIEPVGNANVIAIRTVDHGIGMTAEQVKRIAERFYRADTTGAVAGTGLGMSIVKEIVELHHGKLLVKSRPGRGTTVTLHFPMA